MTQDTELDISRYALISKIGEGSFSKVYRIKDQESNEYYAAKVAKFMIDEDTKESEEVKSLFREVNLMSSFNHPSILKFFGYYPTNFEDDPLPTMITELASNGSLRNLIEEENSGLSPSGWDNTKKLINIYGIASGMSYLHKHNVLHRDLKPENILIDDYLHPKISDFGLSKLTDFLSMSMNYQSQRGTKGTPAYMAPEILRNEKYSKSGDVYAFGFIVYEIMTGEVPYKNDNFYMLMKKITDGYRPTIGSDVPESYRELIESCWSQEESERPTFDEIISNLRENNIFLTETVDEEEFYDYVEFIDNYQSTFDIANRIIHFSEFIESKGRNKIIQKLSINKTEPAKSETNSTSNSPNSSIQNKTKKSNENKSITTNTSQKEQIEIISNEYNGSPQKINEIENSNNKINEIERISSEDCIYPISEFNKLTKSCQKLVEESKTDPSKQFIIGKSLIEGTNGFPENIEVGIKYIEESIKHNFIESIIYYCEHLIRGDIIPRNLQKSKEYLSKLNSTQDSRIFYLQGKISYKEKRYNESAQYFEEGIKNGDKSSIYEYGKMHFLGEGIKKDDKEFLKYMNKSKELGYLKAEYFLRAYDIMKQIKEFNLLPSETQLIFINNNIKNISKQNKNEFDQLFIKPKTTEKLFYNKSLASSNFIKCLTKYKKITIEIEYPIALFGKINDLVIKIQKRKIKCIEIGIVFSSFPRIISKSCFSKNISYQTIDKSIHDIPSEAFKECSSLTQILIPSSVTSIGEFAFVACSSLTQISIPSSVTRIGFSAFAACSSLTQISIPSSVTEIGEYAFFKCSSLTQISIPSSVTSIGEYAFEECSSLTQISIPSSVTKIGDGIFANCFKLNKISIFQCQKKRIVYFEDKFLIYKTEKASSNYDNLLWVNPNHRIITIPSFVKIIRYFAFSGCKSLTQISIPSSVTKIGHHAFSECSSLTQISIPSSVTLIEDNTFKGCSSLTQISIPSSVTSISDFAFYRCSSLTQISIPSSVTKISNKTFSECSSLTQISIPSSVTSIGDFAFNGCSSLTQITIPSSVTSIGNSAFSNCSSLTQITIPSSVTSIGNSAFSGCSSLAQITIPSSVTEIGWNAFDECSSLTQITIPSSVTSIGNDAFHRCSSLTQVSIPSSVTEIGKYAFSECSSLTQISIPSSVTKIENNAFHACSSLTQITIPSSVTSIGNAFCGCSSLAQITIPSSVTSIGDFAFYKCSSLTQITIPSSVTEIGKYAFYECSSLTQISIPSSVTSIGYHAFHRCSSLAQISIPSSLITQLSKIKRRVKIIET